ncbi:MAG TPA: haloalkane dehalogenase [Myxococcaceae bacterium]|nr:haloalkane dehalogenase [Myxococcaceae bacterium]
MSTAGARVEQQLHQVEVLGSRMAYVDRGAGAPILLLHGNPTSSYVWRNILPYLEPLGRCIAPDLIGMGHSGKPELAYRFADHARYLEAFIDALGLDRATVVAHDWGSALGFDWMTRHPARVRRLAFFEAFLAPLPGFEVFSPGNRELFRQFRTPGAGERLVLEQNAFLERVLPGGILRSLSAAEMDAYRAPFPDPGSRRPMLAWPREIPIDGEPADVLAVIERYRLTLQRSPIPKLLLTPDPGVLVPAPLVAWCREHLPNLEVVELGPGLHSLQEDHPDAIGRAIAEWIRRT